MDAGGGVEGGVVVFGVDSEVLGAEDDAAEAVEGSAGVGAGAAAGALEPASSFFLGRNAALMSPIPTKKSSVNQVSGARTARAARRTHMG